MRPSRPFYDSQATRATVKEAGGQQIGGPRRERRFMAESQSPGCEEREPQQSAAIAVIFLLCRRCRRFDLRSQAVSFAEPGSSYIFDRPRAQETYCEACAPRHRSMVLYCTHRRAGFWHLGFLGVAEAERKHWGTIVWREWRRVEGEFGWRGEKSPIPTYCIPSPVA